ncbi:TetR/AcrR family transcriptional regulator C-terminal domain-containing protein [Longispora sp. K20-0274]|uniref:TetR/AcrR family transcriptional regulator C-terminal domain-containing protein n=1 Tax=Longispora sp. K20-0274 TaxID=3088255 RepID=UPI00399B7239
MALDAETIVREALLLLRRDGLAGLTFRALTTRLGVKAPAIYWRFANKQELLEAVAEAILREQFDEPAPATDRPWRDQLTATLHRLRTALLGYPDGARVVVGARPLGTPTLARIAEDALTTLDAAGVGPADAANIVFTAVHYTFGHVIEEQDSAGATEMDAETAARFVRDHPAIGRAMAIGAGADRADIYAAGLALIIGRP